VRKLPNDLRFWIMSVLLAGLLGMQAAMRGWAAPLNVFQLDSPYTGGSNQYTGQLHTHSEGTGELIRQLLWRKLVEMLAMIL
jgi:hypothetical protein